MTHPLMQYVHQHTFNMNDYVRQGIDNAIVQIEREVGITHDAHETVDINRQPLDYCIHMVSVLSLLRKRRMTKYTVPTTFVQLHQRHAIRAGVRASIISAHNVHYYCVQSLMNELSTKIATKLTSRVNKGTLSERNAKSVIRKFIRKYRRYCKADYVTCLKHDPQLLIPIFDDILS